VVRGLGGRQRRHRGGGRRWRQLGAWGRWGWCRRCGGGWRCVFSPLGLAVFGLIRLAPRRWVWDVLHAGHPVAENPIDRMFDAV
jgi:hypothetical protein